MRINQILVRLYWNVFKPRTLGVRVLIINNNQVLLVEHTYISGWYIPGGGVKNGESFEEAIRREVFEEIGIKLQNMELFGVYQNKKEGKQDTVVTFISKQKLSTNLGLKDKEIKNIGFFDINNLPSDVSSGSRRRINEYLSKNYPKVGVW